MLQVVPELQVILFLLYFRLHRKIPSLLLRPKLQWHRLPLSNLFGQRFLASLESPVGRTFPFLQWRQWLLFGLCIRGFLESQAVLLILSLLFHLSLQ